MSECAPMRDSILDPDSPSVCQVHQDEWWPCQAFRDSAHGECYSCGDDECPEGECAQSKRPCGHHCNCSWVHDVCHWCEAEFGEGGELT